MYDGNLNDFDAVNSYLDGETIDNNGTQRGLPTTPQDQTPTRAPETACSAATTTPGSTRARSAGRGRTSSTRGSTGTITTSSSRTPVRGTCTTTGCTTPGCRVDPTTQPFHT